MKKQNTSSWEESPRKKKNQGNQRKKISKK